MMWRFDAESRGDNRADYEDKLYIYVGGELSLVATNPARSRSNSGRDLNFSSLLSLIFSTINSTPRNQHQFEKLHGSTSQFD